MLQMFSLSIVVLIAFVLIGIQGLVLKEYDHVGHKHSATYYGAKLNQWLSENAHARPVRNHAHYEHMLENYASNEDFITHVNSQNLSYTLGHNMFSHMDRAEWNSHRGSIIQHGFVEASKDVTPPLKTNAEIRLGAHTTGTRAGINSRKLPHVEELPASVDWSKIPGIVTPVKQQGLCGSCYAFAAIAAIEAAYNVHNINQRGLGGSKMITLSEQQVVDCDRNGDSGCVGGAMENVYDWASSLGYLCTADSYQYVSGETQKHGECVQTSCEKVSKAAPKSWVEVERGSDRALMEALAVMPVSVGIDADADDFQFYKSGVYSGSCGTVVNHGLLAVGYGKSRGGEDYYKFKNCWGTGWGNDGYIKVKRGEVGAHAKGRCAMLSQITHPVFN